MALQRDWRFCQRCFVMFFNGFPSKGTCPAGGGHQAQGFNFALPFDSAVTPQTQDAWRFCEKCFAIFFAGFAQKGRCPVGGEHAMQGFNFRLPHDIPPSATAQDRWRFCQKCDAMFFEGFPQKGVCPAGGAHQAQGFMFVLPHDIPQIRDFDFNPIVFGGGVPVGGRSHVTLREDGTYTFSGHFHASGATSHNVAVAWGVKDSQNLLYGFAHGGRVAGTFEPGSRDHDWNIESRDDRIAANWAYLGAAAGSHTTAQANLNLGGVSQLIDTVGKAVGVVSQIIKIVV